jgi:hypothetical protein
MERYGRRFAVWEGENYGWKPDCQRSCLRHRFHRIQKGAITMAPTSTAANNIGGSTYHTSLQISFDRSRLDIAMILQHE